MHYTHNSYFSNHQHFHLGDFFTAVLVLAINSKDYLAHNVEQINKDIHHPQPTSTGT